MVEKVYTMKVSTTIRTEIYDLVRRGILIKGEKTHAGHIKLVYATSGKEAATYCPKCKQIYDESESHRSSMYNHAKSHEAANLNEDDEIVVPAYFRDELKRALAFLCSEDVLPFSFVENEGFRKFCDFLYRESFEHAVMATVNSPVLKSPPVISDFFPSRNTVKSFVSGYINNKHPQFLDYVRVNIENSGAAIDIDFVTKAHHFVGSTIHFIDDQWRLKNYALDIHGYTESSNAEAIAEVFETTMGKHGLNSRLLKEKVIFTIDCDKKLIKAFADHERLNDPMHLLNTCCKRITSSYKKSYLPDQTSISEDVRTTLCEIDSLNKDAIKIINAVRERESLHNALKEEGPALVRPVEPRFLSHYYSIDSIVKLSENANQTQLIFDALYDYRDSSKKLLYREALVRVFDHIEVLKCYVELVAPIERAVKILQSEQHPTINLVLLRYNKIYAHFYRNTTHENQYMQAMAICGRRVLEYQRNLLTDLHLIGLLLDPINKDSLWTYENEEERLMPKFTEISPVQAGEMLLKYVRKYSREDCEESGTRASPFAAAFENDIDLFQAEVTTYLKIPSTAMAARYNDVLDFWREPQNHRRFSHIAVLAKRILPILSSTSTERMFSLLAAELTKKRNKLSTESASNLIVMKNLNKFLEEFNEES